MLKKLVKLEKVLNILLEINCYLKKNYIKVIALKILKILFLFLKKLKIILKKKKKKN